MDTSYRDAINTDGLIAEQIQAKFCETSIPAKLTTNAWWRVDGGLERDGKSWRFDHKDGFQFTVNMETWLSKDQGGRINYGNDRASDARTKVKKESTTLLHGSPSAASPTHSSAPAPAESPAVQGAASSSSSDERMTSEQIQERLDTAQERQLDTARSDSCDVVNFASLPFEVLFEIAIGCPIWPFRRVARLDVRLVACVRLQRWHRSLEHHNSSRLSVGDRVLFRHSANTHQYATAAAEVKERHMWKLVLLTGAYATVPYSHIRRLEPWSDGPWASNVGRSSALESASRARSAATYASNMATMAMRTGISATHSALAIAAATAASTAAAAASSAAVVAVSQVEKQQAIVTQELLLAAQQMQDSVFVPLAIRGNATDGEASLIAQAASAANEAVTEAAAAASAASAVEAIGTLEVTSSTVATAANAAEQVVNAIEALEASLPSTLGSMSINDTAAADIAATSAADALNDVSVAGDALTQSWLQSCGNSSELDASQSTVRALHVMQEAARMLHGAAQPSSSTSSPGCAVKNQSNMQGHETDFTTLQEYNMTRSAAAESLEDEQETPSAHASKPSYEDLVDVLDGANDQLSVVACPFKLALLPDLSLPKGLSTTVRVLHGESAVQGCSWLRDMSHDYELVNPERSQLGEYEQIIAQSMPGVSLRPVRCTASTGFCSLVLSDGDCVIGGATLCLSLVRDHGASPIAVEQMVSASPDPTTDVACTLVMEIAILGLCGSARRHGCGSLLLSCAACILEHQLPASGASTSYLIAQAGNDSLPFWHKNGYRVDGHARLYIEVLAKCMRTKIYESATAVGTLPSGCQVKLELAVKLRHQAQLLAKTSTPVVGPCFIMHAIELRDMDHEIACIRIRELDRECLVHDLEHEEQDVTGMTIWPASLVFANWIAGHRSLTEGRRVCELGSGCGLAGLAAAILGGAAHVVLTDADAQVISNLRHNVEINSATLRASTFVEVCVLAWRCPDDTSAPDNTDILIGTDLSYADGMTDALSSAVVRLLRPGGLFLYIGPSSGRIEDAGHLQAALAGFGVVLKQEYDAPRLPRSSTRSASDGGLVSWWPVANAAASMAFRIQIYIKSSSLPPPLHLSGLAPPSLSLPSAPPSPPESQQTNDEQALTPWEAPAVLLPLLGTSPMPSDATAWSSTDVASLLQLPSTDGEATASSTLCIGDAPRSSTEGIMLASSIATRKLTFMQLKYLQLDATERCATEQLAEQRLRDQHLEACRAFGDANLPAFQVPSTRLSGLDSDAVWVVREVMTADECALLRSAAEKAATVCGGWDKGRHRSYPTTDLPVSAVPAVEAHVRERVFERIIEPMSRIYCAADFLPELLEVNDFFYVKYSASPEQQRELRRHADASLFSFNLLLSDPQVDFKGGGTFFESMGWTVRIEQGSSIVHDGHAFHGGFPIVCGERYILVGFVQETRRAAYSVMESKSAAADAFARFGHAAWRRFNTKIQQSPIIRLNEKSKEVHLIGLPTTFACALARTRVKDVPFADIIKHLIRAFSEALPNMPPERMVDLLEFISAQHPRTSEIDDNSHLLKQIVAVCNERPFVLSEEGIRSLTSLALYAQASSTLEGNPFSYPLKSLEFQFWMLIESALNTQSAISAFDCNINACFQAIQQDTQTRSTYTRRLYAWRTIQAHPVVEHVVTSVADRRSRPSASVQAQHRPFFLTKPFFFFGLALLAIAILWPASQLSRGGGNRRLTAEMTEAATFLTRVSLNDSGTHAMQRVCQTMLPQLIVFNTWHKAGTVLAGSLFDTLLQICPRAKIGIGSDTALQRSGLCQPPQRKQRKGITPWQQKPTLLQAILHGRGKSHGRTEPSALLHLNSASYIRLHVPHPCLVALSPARARFIHFIRDPFAVVSSFFLFHLTGQECNFPDMLVICAALRKGAGQPNVSQMNPGLTHALQISVDKLLKSPLPQMAELHIALRSSAHTLTLRMESFQRNFDGTVEQLLGFLHVTPSTWLHSRLLSELQKHDAMRWHPSKLQASDHVNPGRAVGLTSEAVLEALARNEKQTGSLTNLSQLLGYSLNALDLTRSRS